MPNNYRLGQAVRAAAKPLVLLWTGALVLAGFALASAPAAFAAPSPDMIIPTGTANVTCAQGQDALLSCQTDNSALTYYMDSGGEYELEAPDRADVQTAMSQYNATDLSVSYDASPTFSGSAETDVVYQEGSTGMSAGTIGMTWCNDPSDNYAYRCDQQYVRIRGNGNITPISAGHETGHAVGLLHGPFAYPSQTVCASVMGIMRSAATCSDSAALGSTVIANINAIY